MLAHKTSLGSTGRIWKKILLCWGTRHPSDGFEVVLYLCHISPAGFTCTICLSVFLPISLQVFLFVFLSLSLTGILLFCPLSFPLSHSLRQTTISDFLIKAVPYTRTHTHTQTRTVMFCSHTQNYNNHLPAVRFQNLRNSKIIIISFQSFGHKWWELSRNWKNNLRSIFS